MDIDVIVYLITSFEGDLIRHTIVFSNPKLDQVPDKHIRYKLRTIFFVKL